MKFTKSGALRFLFSYVFSYVISIAAYAIPVIILSPIIMGTVIDFATKNSDKLNPLSYGIAAFFLIIFFVCFIIFHIYKNKEIKLQFQKDTKEGFVLKDELVKYIKQYGIPDLVYYVVCSLIAALFTGGTDTMIYDFIDNTFLRIVPAVFVFAIIYTASVAIILKIWDKKRPDYLKKGYVEKNNY